MLVILPARDANCDVAVRKDAIVEVRPSGRGSNVHMASWAGGHVVPTMLSVKQVVERVNLDVAQAGCLFDVDPAYAETKYHQG